MLPCVCLVIDHRGRQNVVRTSVRQHGVYLLNRWTEMDKTRALKENKGNFDKPMRLSTEAKGELHW